MTQALAVQQWCRRHGHQVVGVLAGAHRNRNWPDFFERGFATPVTRLTSPGFVYRGGRRVNLPATVWQFLTRAGEFRRSLDVLDTALRETQPDLVINFLEPLVGAHARLRRRRVPVLAVGHQFLLEHPAYPRPSESRAQQLGLRQYVRLSGAGAVHYALSFYEAPNRLEHGQFVAPPLLREELFRLDGSRSDGHFLVYLLNAGYRADVEAWHARHPGVPLHVFYDRPGAAELERVDASLTFHRLHGEKFLRLMATCRGVVCTAGFESLSEAAWLGKPTLAVPVEGHIEQSLNAVDAEQAGLALAARKFDLDPLLRLTRNAAQERFARWVSQSDTRLLRAVHYTAMAGGALRSGPLSGRRPTAPAAMES